MIDVCKQTNIILFDIITHICQLPFNRVNNQKTRKKILSISETTSDIKFEFI